MLKRMSFLNINRPSENHPRVLAIAVRCSGHRLWMMDKYDLRYAAEQSSGTMVQDSETSGQAEQYISSVNITSDATTAVEDQKEVCEAARAELEEVKQSCKTPV
jgi:hypothetical protein